MLFFKASKSVIKQKHNFIKEVYYKLFKLFVIFLKWNNLLGGLILQKRRSLYYRNICIVSQKAKSISRKLKVSRIVLRDKANIGFFFGLVKLSW